MTRSAFLAAAPVALAALALATSAGSQTPTAAQTCMACHGPAGVSAAPTFPNLAGQKSGYLEA